MLKLALSPFRCEVGVNYDSAFLYLSTRGAVAERWAHMPGFGRHAIGVDSLRLTNIAASRIAEVNLKNGRFVVAGPSIEWDDFVSSSSEFLTDCLKTVQPEGVLGIYADLKFYSPAQDFDTVRDTIASELLRGQCKHPPDAAAGFEDLSVSLMFRKGNTHINTMLGPMRKYELRPQLDGDPDLEPYPETLLFVHRRYDVLASRNPSEARFDWETAKEHLESFVAEDLASAPGDVSSYLASILHAKEE